MALESLQHDVPEDDVLALRAAYHRASAELGGLATRLRTVEEDLSAIEQNARTCKNEPTAQRMK